jgi:sulfate permease, SulP family
VSAGRTTLWRKRTAARLAAVLPRREDYAGFRASWRADVVAGVTVGVVAIPLALAFGITTGLGAAAGMATAIVAGLLAAVFGGSHVQVSGPTGAMTVVLVPVVARHGAGAVALVGFLAGLLIIVAGLSRLGRYLALIPWPVVEGFTVGIAVIILFQQVPTALGVERPAGDKTVVVAARALADAWQQGSGSAIIVAVLTGLVMLALPRLHRALPASLLAVAAVTAVTNLAGLDVASIGSLPASLPAPSLPTFSVDWLRSLSGPALAIAVLAALESLLSARVADGMADSPRHDPDRELFGQGVANLVAPLFGGMPATGAIARTAVNIRAGARTRAAAITHAIVLLGVVYLAGGAVARVPLAALAGVLAVTALRMIDVHNVRTVLRSTRSDAGVLILTASATVAFDLITAVEAGIVVAGALALRKVALTAAFIAEPVAVQDGGEVTGEDEASLFSEHIVAYRLDGALFFGAAQRFLTELTGVADVRVVILRLPDLQVLDATGAQALGEIVAELERRRVTVLIKGARPEHLSVLRAVGALDRLAHANHVFADLDAAIAHAQAHVHRDSGRSAAQAASASVVAPRHR